MQAAAHLPIHRQNRIDNTHGGTIVSIFKRVGRACPCARRVGNTSRAEAGDRVNLNRCTDTVTATDRPIQSLLLKPHSLFAYTLQHPFLSSSLFLFPPFFFFSSRAPLSPPPPLVMLQFVFAATLLTPTRVSRPPLASIIEYRRELINRSFTEAVSPKGTREGLAPRDAG